MKPSRKNAPRHEEAAYSLGVGIKMQLALNIQDAVRRIAFDGATLLACAALFFLNTHVLIGAAETAWPSSAFASALRSHGNDLLGGYAFLAYTNLLLDLVNPQVRIRQLVTCLVFIFACGLFWELAAPLFVSDSVGDPLDVVAYLVGAIIYWLIHRALAAHLHCLRQQN